MEFGSLMVAGTYAAIGALFALGFVIRGAAALAPGARGASIAFRLMLIPGAILLWPYLLVRWATVKGPTTAKAHP